MALLPLRQKVTGAAPPSWAGRGGPGQSSGATPVAGVTLVAPAAEVAAACGPGRLCPTHRSSRVACHLPSQGLSRLAIPRVLCNLLKENPSEQSRPAGIGFALSWYTKRPAGWQRARQYSCHTHRTRRSLHRSHGRKSQEKGGTRRAYGNGCGPMCRAHVSTRHPPRDAGNT